MIIDIDIKIANSSGKLVHSFSKRFNERLDLSDNIEKDNGMSKDFEDFLAEYLTASGRVVRKKLITEVSGGIQNSGLRSEAGRYWEETDDGITDSEMEYRIRIGKNKVIAGRIPFQRLNRLNSVTNALDKAEDEYLGVSESSSIINRTDYTGFDGSGLSPDTGRKDVTADLERNIQNLMIQAVEKYESNFYHMEKEKEEYSQL
jgi:hypothetical protein